MRATGLDQKKHLKRGLWVIYACVGRQIRSNTGGVCKRATCHVSRNSYCQ